MKNALSMFLFLLSLITQAQDETNYETSEQETATQEEREITEEVVDENQIAAPKIESKKPTEQTQQVIRVECVCPDSGGQAQEAETTVNSLFPEDSVFIISPEPQVPVPEQQEEEEEKKNVIPGYPEKVPRGYDADTYKEIPWE
jgi:hypothetical protein